VHVVTEVDHLCVGVCVCVCVSRVCVCVCVCVCVNGRNVNVNISGYILNKRQKYNKHKPVCVKNNGGDYLDVCVCVCVCVCVPTKSSISSFDSIRSKSAARTLYILLKCRALKRSNDSGSCVRLYVLLRVCVCVCGVCVGCVFVYLGCVWKWVMILRRSTKAWSLRRARS